MDDYGFQAGFVGGSAWRLLAMQDANPHSPSHGCFHYAYWRDKVSEFPDARYQEAGATLGLLSLPEMAPWRDAAGPTPEALRQGFRAGLHALARQQRADGSFDEWYKGERGYAACCFPAIAYGLAGHFLSAQLTGPEREMLSSVLRKAGFWLLSRRDAVKANHEAAGAAALALAWDFTREERFLTGARAKLADTLARQRPEGWFPEVGGMDLGYCSVLMDYVMLTAHFAQATDQALPAMQRLVAFMLPHLQPDLTISPEAGLCLNPYVGRLGLGLLSAHDAAAAAVVRAFSDRSAGTDGLLPYLADDLRLARWSHLPLVTLLLRQHFVAGEREFCECYPQGWLLRQDSSIAAYHDGQSHVFFSPAGGGCVRVYLGQRLVLEDFGVDVRGSGGVLLTGGGYDTGRGLRLEGGAAVCESGLGAPSFFFPGFLSRLVLRLGCTTALGSRLLRAFIDWWRIRSGTAINQSAAPLAASQGGVRVRRRVQVEAGGVEVVDEVRAQQPLAPGDICLRLRGAAADGAISPDRSSVAWRLSKCVSQEGSVALRLEPLEA